MMTLTEQQNVAADKICKRFEAAITKRTEFQGDVILTTPPDAILDVLRYARDAAGFDMLVNLCSVDNFGAEPRFEVIYVVTQAENGVNLEFRVPVAEGGSVPSCVPIYRGANWLERETYDMMGIVFENHPDLRRIMMWEEYPYYPLRKDFPVQGLPTELPGVAFTEKAPTGGAPFATRPGVCPSAEREPRERGCDC